VGLLSSLLADSTARFLPLPFDVTFQGFLFVRGVSILSGSSSVSGLPGIGVAGTGVKSGRVGKIEVLPTGTWSVGAGLTGREKPVVEVIVVGLVGVSAWEVGLVSSKSSYAAWDSENETTVGDSALPASLAFI
jgi:hypothetical protein